MIYFLKNFPENFYLVVGQATDKFHQPDCKTHQPWAIEHALLCKLLTLNRFLSISFFGIRLLLHCNFPEQNHELFLPPTPHTGFLSYTPPSRKYSSLTWTFSFLLLHESLKQLRLAHTRGLVTGICHCD